MKESYWGVLVAVLGITAISFIYLFQNVTNKDEHNHHILTEATEGAMIDAFDYQAYRTNKEVRIIREKFVESFMRRFAESANLGMDYKFDIYDINEMPPKVSLRVVSNENGAVYGMESTNFGIENRISAILETKEKVKR